MEGEKINDSLGLPTYADIVDAAHTLSSVVQETPLQSNKRLSDLCNAHVYLKREDLQQVRSYKIRGAYNKVAHLLENERSKAVIAASAGNHAQGVAYTCSALKIAGRIYVPSNTPKQKKDRIKNFGGKWIDLIVQGASYDEAAIAAEKDSANTDAVWVHAFNDKYTIAGQGTIGLEISEQLSIRAASPDYVIVPVGGGGCIAGISLAIRHNFPKAKIIGVEPEGAASLSAAIRHGAPIKLDDINPFVDGAAVKKVGSIPYAILSSLGVKIIDHSHNIKRDNSIMIMTVPEGQVCSTILQLYQEDGIIAEPAGALAISALRYLTFPPDAHVVALISGGNNDISRYGEIIERSLVFEGLKHYFLVDFTQTPGSLRRFLDSVLGPDDDITLFEYVKKNNRETGAALVGIELSSPAALESLLARIDKSSLHIEQLEPGSTEYQYLT